MINVLCVSNTLYCFVCTLFRRTGIKYHHKILTMLSMLRLSIESINSWHFWRHWLINWSWLTFKKRQRWRVNRIPDAMLRYANAFRYLRLCAIYLLLLTSQKAINLCTHRTIPNGWEFPQVGLLRFSTPLIYTFIRLLANLVQVDRDNA